MFGEQGKGEHAQMILEKIMEMLSMMPEKEEKPEGTAIVMEAAEPDEDDKKPGC